VPRAMMSALTSGRQRHLAHMHLENLLATTNVGQRHDDLAVETTRTHQRRIEHVGTVGGGDDDDADAAFEAIHLDQHLVQRLFALVVAAAEAGAALATDGIEFVDEDDAGGVLLGVLEHVAHAAAPTPTNISTKSEPEIERTAPWPRRQWRLGQQRLAGTRVADQQHALRDAATEFLEFRGIAQEIDQFGDFFLGLVATGDVGEGDGVGRFVEQRALLLPNEKAPPLPPPCIWRMKKIQTPISSSIGNQLTKMLIRKDCSSSGLASILTPFFSRSETIHRSGGA
jgi:hypothetical protein